MPEQRTSYRWFPFVTAVFITTLIVSNIIAVKIVHIAGLFLPAAVILFPVAYIFGDILTEVYGYGRARQVIWTGFFCNLLAVIAIWLAGRLPAAPFWSAGAFQTPETAQSAYQAILGFTPRLLLASFIAYLIGEFLNSFVLARLKVRTAGRFLWLRTITSTLVGQGADSAVFISIAFVGIFPAGDLGQAILSQWLFKVVYEALATPLTYLIVNALKKAEGVDYYDRDTDFNPLSVKSQ
ncbi:MAG TPA: queuosine precursor transporter [Anaerolineales bacterium]|nr:queuosine precursor transporter [Anaerolineales bacterium]